MDQNLNPIPTEETPDLSKQYQDILNKYSQELNKTPTPQPEPQPQPEPEPQSEPQPIAVEPTIPPESESNIFKYFFFFSLIVFLVVFGLVIKSIFFSNITPQDSAKNLTPAPSPTATSGAVCLLNDKQYQIGESFKSADGCNTCSCGIDLTVSCTELACDSTPTATPSATSVKSYKNSVFGFSFDYPKTLTLTDQLPKTKTDYTSTKEKLTLTDKINKYTVTIHVLPDGFGPFFPDRSFVLTYSNEKGLVVAEKKDNTENLSLENRLVQFSYQGKDHPTILVFATSPKSDQNLEELTLQLLSTLRFN
ncbi:MAG TPA: hypothetical protein PK639_01015 [Candidatus Woesebacteria bacterium]|nr:hypothetical protein [Candidatus Woesebacteria bacterium]